MKSKKEDRKLDVFQILKDFITARSVDGSSGNVKEMCELATHTFAIIAANHEFKDENILELEHSRHVLNWLMNSQMQFMSERCKTACLVLLLKVNDLAFAFVD